MKLAEELEGYTRVDLEALVRTCRGLVGGAPRGTRKAQLIDYLVRSLTAPGALPTLLAALEPLEREALAAAAHLGGTFDAEAFLARHGSLPGAIVDRSGSFYRGFGYGRKAQPFDLFLHRRAVPAELAEALAAALPAPEPFRLQGSTEAPDAAPDDPARPLRRADTEVAGLHDLSVHLQLTEAGRLVRSAASEQLTPKSLEALLAGLLEGDLLPHQGRPRLQDTIRPFGLDVFARSSGLLGRGGRGLSARGRAFLYERSPEALLDAFETWTQAGSFDELSRVEALKAQKAKATLLTAPQERREAVIEALSWCPDGEWISVEAFYGAIKIWHLEPEIEAPGSRGLYLHHPLYGRLEDYPRSVRRALVTGLYLNALLMESLGSIGAVDLLFLPAEDAGLRVPHPGLSGPFSRYDGLAYFRINPLGAYLLGQASAYQVPEGLSAPRFTIGNDLTLRLDPARTPTPLLEEWLDRVATPLGGGRYRLETRTLLEAVEGGTPVEHLRAFLERGHDGPLPSVVTRWLQEIEGRLGALEHQGGALLVGVRSSAALEAILADGVLGKMVELIGGSTLVVPARREAAVRKRLKDLGYLLPPRSP